MIDLVKEFCNKYSLSEKAFNELIKIVKKSYIEGSNDCHKNLKESTTITKTNKIKAKQ